MNLLSAGDLSVEEAGADEQNSQEIINLYACDLCLTCHQVGKFSQF